MLKLPNVLTADEIKTLVGGLGLREKTLVLLAASTGLRQSELFGLKWRDINFDERTINVTRSIVCGVVRHCKTESSQKPVPVHPLIVETLLKWREQQPYRKPEDWVFASRHNRGRKPLWGQSILRKFIRPKAQELGIQKHFADSKSEFYQWSTLKFAPYGWNVRHKRPMRRMGGMCAVSALCAIWVECAP